MAPHAHPSATPRRWRLALLLGVVSVLSSISAPVAGDDRSAGCDAALWRDFEDRLSQAAESTVGDIGDGPLHALRQAIKQLSKARKRRNGAPAVGLLASGSDSSHRMLTDLLEFVLFDYPDGYKHAAREHRGVLNIHGNDFSGPDSVDALRDAVQNQLSACPGSLLVFHSSIPAAYVGSIVSPLVKFNQDGPPLLLLLLSSQATAATPSTAASAALTSSFAWARKLIPTAAIVQMDGAGETAEGQQQQIAAKDRRRAEAQEMLRREQAQRKEAEAKLRVERELQEQADKAAREAAEEAAVCEKIQIMRSEVQNQPLVSEERITDQPYTFAELDSVGGYIGQQWAIDVIKPLIENRLHGFDRRKQPLVMIFTGPSGVGKTELAHHIAAMTHDTTPQAMRTGDKRHCFVQLPMNQYQDERSIDNLIGPPVGIQGEGQLTGALKKCPTAVVLLDEFEKAHPSAIPDVFLGAFDARATLVDTKSGETIATNDAIFILTSNYGAEEVMDYEEDLLSSEAARVQAARRAVHRAVMKKFESPSTQNPFSKPEFRSRIRDVAIFTPFRHEERSRVAGIALREMAAHYLAEPRTQYVVAWTPAVISYFSCFYGGNEGKGGLRPLVSSVEQCDTKLRLHKIPPRRGVLFDVQLGDAQDKCERLKSGNLLVRSCRLVDNDTDPVLLDDISADLKPREQCDDTDYSQASVEILTDTSLETEQTNVEQLDSRHRLVVRDDEDATLSEKELELHQLLDEQIARTESLQKEVLTLKEQLALYERYMLYLFLTLAAVLVVSVVLLPLLFKALIGTLLMWLTFFVAIAVAIWWYFPAVAKFFRWLAGWVWQHPRLAGVVLIISYGCYLRHSWYKKASADKQLTEFRAKAENLQQKVTELKQDKDTMMKIEKELKEEIQQLRERLQDCKAEEKTLQLAEQASTLAQINGSKPLDSPQVNTPLVVDPDESGSLPVTWSQSSDVSRDFGQYIK